MTSQVLAPVNPGGCSVGRRREAWLHEAMVSYRHGVARDHAERRALSVVLGSCFGFPSDDALVWLGKAGEDNIRVLRAGGAHAGHSQIPNG